MIVVTTPTGDIGHRVLQRVVQGGESVRVVARDPSRLPQEIRERAEIVSGSHGDAAVIEKALNGADSLFWLVPPNSRARSLEEAYVGFTKPAAEAVTKCGVKRVVAIAALGRGWKKDAGLLTASIEAADVLAATGVALRVLALPSFMENLLGQADAIRERGTFSSPLLAERKVPTVATRDIAAVAAGFLMDTTWSGRADVPVLGPEDLSPNEMAQVLSDVLGKPVRFEQVSMDAFRNRLARWASPAFAQGLADMMTAKNEGIDNSASRSQAANTPTTFRQWSESVLKPAILRSGQESPAHA